ncbi:SIMPL domain-containing protein [Nocardioides sp.]|uniref:SIMPL domain-containing protein n=1 Tax=Nocardioides sp. TaxID=35761 RepID=UPI002ED04BB0
MSARSMNGEVTLSVKGLLVTGLVLLALVTSYLLGAGGGGAAPAQAQPGDPTASEATTAPGTLRTVGTGEVSVVPDQLTFALSVTDKQFDLDRALTNSSATMRRVLAALREHGVRSADVQTTGLQMYPEYDYPAYAPPVLTGYRVTQKSRVTVRDLAQGGRAVTTAVETGGNGVRATDLRLGVSDPAGALDRARDAAVEDASARAERYAAATGTELGDVLTLREVTGDRAPQPRDWVYKAHRATLDELSAVPIRAGKADLAVKVEIVWAIGSGSD